MVFSVTSGLFCRHAAHIMRSLLDSITPSMKYAFVVTALIYDEELPQDVAVFSAEPAPISVGVLIDTSPLESSAKAQAALCEGEVLL